MNRHEEPKSGYVGGDYDEEPHHLRRAQPDKYCFTGAPDLSGWRGIMLSSIFTLMSVPGISI